MSLTLANAVECAEKTSATTAPIVVASMSPAGGVAVATSVASAGWDTEGSASWVFVELVPLSEQETDSKHMQLTTSVDDRLALHSIGLPPSEPLDAYPVVWGPLHPSVRSRFSRKSHPTASFPCSETINETMMRMRGQRSTDQDLLEGLYRENCHRVYSFARSRLGESNATDITSEVFHAATIAIRDGKGDLVTTAWLLAVTRNKVYDHWRRAYRRKAKAHLIRGRREDRTEFPQDWHEDARRPAVVAALDAMSDRHRGLLILHHVDGMTIAELADVTGQTSAAIESALARARKRFRDLYRDGFDG